jgi:hypothetical protein
MADYRRGMDWWMDLLTTYTRDLELQAITALSLMYTLKIITEPAKPFPACCVFISRSLATASNSGDSSASRDQVLSVQRIPRNWTLSIINSTIAPSHLSLPCRARLNCQPSTNWIALVVFFITPRRGPHRNTVLLLLRVCSFPLERVYRAVAQKLPFIYSFIA